jgi:hypothetical protein
MADVAFMQEIALRTAIVCNTDQRLDYMMSTKWKTSATFWRKATFRYAKLWIRNKTNRTWRISRALRFRLIVAVSDDYVS